MKKEKESGERQNPGPLSSEKTVGELLVEGRKRDGRSRARISEITKIPEASLKYLETDNFEMLPAPVYVMGFLRSYASELGMDVDYILSKYQVHSGHDHRTRGDHWEEKEIEEEPQKDYSVLIRKLALPVSALLIVIIAGVILINRGEDIDVKPPSAIPQANEFVDSVTRKRLAAAEKETSSSNDTEPVSPAQNIRNKPEDVDNMKLKLSATDSDSTWFDIITITLKENRSDTTYHDFILFPGNEKVLTAGEAFVLRTIGNAGGFTAELNGRRLPLFGNRHEIVRGVYLGRDSLSLETD